MSFRELNRPLLAALALERTMIGFGVALIMAVAALNLLCNLTLLAAEKRLDTALLQAMGLEPVRLRQLFLLLGVGVGAAGGVAGTVLGALGAWVLDLTPRDPSSGRCFHCLARAVPSDRGGRGGGSGHLDAGGPGGVPASGARGGPAQRRGGPAV